VGRERDETSTEEKGTKNETIKSKVYVKDGQFYFLVFGIFNCWYLVTSIGSCFYDYYLNCSFFLFLSIYSNICMFLV